MQRGGGLGGFFSGLVRGAVPLIKAGLGMLAPHAKKASRQVVGDILKGKNLGSSLIKRTRQIGKAVRHDVISRVPGNAPLIKKRKTGPASRRLIVATKRRPKRKYPDAF